MRLRIGHLDFLNVYPVYRGLELLGLADGRLEPVPCGPDPVRLNGLLAGGRLDAAPSSSALLVAEPDLSVLPGPTVSARGPVGSVLLFTACAPEELAGRRVLLPANSATSVALLRVLAAYRWGVRPEFAPWAGPPPRAEEVARSLGREADGVLVIGDEALRAGILFPGLRRVDLGLEWWTWTGHPMVFSLWLGRRGLPAAVARWAGRLLRAAAARGLAALRENPAELAELARRRGLPVAALRHYYDACLDFGHGPEHRKGLFLFVRLARRVAGGGVAGGPLVPGGPHAAQNGAARSGATPTGDGGAGSCSGCGRRAVRAGV